MAIRQQLKRIKRPINGMLLLDKPQGGSSNQILQKVKYLYAAQKAGHTGALDPLASGMLPLCFGETTKFAQFLLDSDKRYRVTIQLGIRTDTSDAEGKVVSQRPVKVTELQLQQALLQFQGEIQQIPTMFSALKHQGRPLYEYARQGLVVAREPRPITVYSIICHGFSGASIDLEIHCSKGTYIRTIADDLGELLGCGGHVTVLRRLQVSDYPIESMISLDRLLELSESGGWAVLDSLLLPVDSPVKTLPKLLLPASLYQRMQHGNSVKLEQNLLSLKIGQVRLFNATGSDFLGVGLLDEQGNVTPQRLLTQQANALS